MSQERIPTDCWLPRCVARLVFWQVSSYGIV